MKIWVDSREKWTQPQSSDTHLSAYFDRHGIEWEVKKLKEYFDKQEQRFADYTAQMSLFSGFLQERL